MTFRAKPVGRGPGRAGWNSGDRRTLLLNAAFVGAIVVSILILVGYTVWSWYDDHYGAAATVDGTAITKDQLRTRFKIDDFRIGYTENRIRTLQTAGRMTEATASSQIQFLEQRRSSLGALVVQRMIDVTLQARLATEAGISVTDPEIDAQLIEEATLKEQRHVWVIEVAPENNADTGSPGDAEKAAAKATADAALADLKGGKAWEDVAKTVSTAASAPQDGDLGWMPKDSGYDEALMTAVFGAELSQPTDVVEGDDGIYRIGRATEVAPETTDSTYEFQIGEAGIAIADYREAVRSDLIRTKLNDKVVADLSAPGPQRHVLQIHIPAASSPMPDGVKVRHILFSPNDDPALAATLPDDDPAWAAAEAEAQAAYETLKADPTKFDEMARTMSDEGSAKTSGGKLPYYDSTSSIDPAFAAAILADGLQPGDLIPPFKSSFGWHVVQFMRPYGDGEGPWLKTIKAQADAGADFAQLARDQGEGPEAADGGDIGWVAKGQVDPLMEAAIFNAPIGSVTDVVEVSGDGAYLFKVLAEETREPTKEQLKNFKDSGFDTWYTAKREAATITTSSSAATVNE